MTTNRSIATNMRNREPNVIFPILIERSNWGPRVSQNLLHGADFPLASVISTGLLYQIRRRLGEIPRFRLLGSNPAEHVEERGVGRNMKIKVQKAMSKQPAATYQGCQGGPSGCTVCAVTQIMPCVSPPNDQKPQN
jgi:hypothetical protein